MVEWFKAFEVYFIGHFLIDKGVKIAVLSGVVYFGDLGIFVFIRISLEKLIVIYNILFWQVLEEAVLDHIFTSVEAVEAIFVVLKVSKQTKLKNVRNLEKR